MSDCILHDHNQKSIDPRGFLKRKAWTGALLLCSLSGGILSSTSLGMAAGRLGAPLDIRSVSASEGQPAWATTDAARASSAAADSHQVAIDNFSFTPSMLTVPVGTTVTWINHDDVPHTVVDTQKRFSSPALDTDEKFSHQFGSPGTYHYFCSVHPHMTATLIVK